MRWCGGSCSVVRGGRVDGSKKAWTIEEGGLDSWALKVLRT